MKKFKEEYFYSMPLLLNRYFTETNNLGYNDYLVSIKYIENSIKLIVESSKGNDLKIILKHCPEGIEIRHVKRTAFIKYTNNFMLEFFKTIHMFLGHNQSNITK